MKLNDIIIPFSSKNEVYFYLDKKNIFIEKKIVSKGVISINSGYYLIPGKVKLNDKSIFKAIFGVSSDDSGELFEVHFWINNKLVSQSNKDLLKKMKKTKGMVFPYKYHLNVKVEGDTHTANQF
jgi:hypothetical protein